MNKKVRAKDWERLCLSYVKHLSVAERKLEGIVRRERRRAARIVKGAQGGLHFLDSLAGKILGKYK